MPILQCKMTGTPKNHQSVACVGRALDNATVRILIRNNISSEGRLGAQNMWTFV